MAIGVERVVLVLRGLTEKRAGDAAVLQESAGLHLLQLGDIRRLGIAEAAFTGEVHDLPADHAADASGARQCACQQQAHRRILVHLVAGDDVERDGERPSPARIAVASSNFL
jgi:hypothetical protein